jgi:chemotaxis protein CheD
MTTDNRKLPVYYLKPGDLHIANQPGIVTTVLGSCVSVTMFNRRREMGAICHGLMPERTEKCSSGRDNGDGFKYVDYSIKYMINHFRSVGIEPSEIEVKLFGGADMFPAGEGDQKYLSVGEKNLMAALSTLKREGMEVHSRDIGGTQGRKLHFYLHTGDVFLKKLKRSDTFRVIRIQSEVVQTEGRQVSVVRRRSLGSDRPRR